ncbi:hypothetical protein Tco_0235901 [Tanacetum coccineum]
MLPVNGADSLTEVQTKQEVLKSLTLNTVVCLLESKHDGTCQIENRMHIFSNITINSRTSSIARNNATVQALLFRMSSGRYGSANNQGKIISRKHRKRKCYQFDVDVFEADQCDAFDVLMLIWLHHTDMFMVNLVLEDPF